MPLYECSAPRRPIGHGVTPPPQETIEAENGYEARKAYALKHICLVSDVMARLKGPKS